LVEFWFRNPRNSVTKLFCNIQYFSASKLVSEVWMDSMKKMVALALLAASLCCGCVVSSAESGDKAVAPPVPETSTAKFKQDVLTGDKPVLVDFYADWCGPCRAMSPVVDKEAAKYKEQLKVFRLNVDKNKELAQALQIESIPLFVVFKNGKVENAAVGLMPEHELDGMLAKAISPATPTPTPGKN
jgi:thioredoxin 1